MAEKKPGLLKRIFSFGFGRKKQAEEEPQVEALEPPKEEVDAAAQAEAAAEAERIAAEKQAAEEEAAAKKKAEAEEAERLAAEKAAKEAEEKKTAEEAAAEKAEAEKARIEEEKATAKAEKEAKAEADRKAAEEAAKLEEKKKADEAKEAARAAEELAQKEAEAAEAAAVEEKRLAEEAAAKAAEEAERKAAEEQAAAEAEEEAARKTAEAEAREKEEAARKAAEAEAKKNEAEKPAKKAKKSAADEAEFDEDAIVSAPTEDLEIEESVVTLTERKAKKQPEPEPEPEEERRQGWLARLTKGLSRSSNQLKENITQVFTDKKLDEDSLQDLEDVLIQADLGVETAMKITDALEEKKFGKTVTEQEVREVMAEEIEKILDPVALDLDLDLDHQPHVILVVGVNGSGKTTTIGKLASKLYDAGFSTTLVAGDTFRAAAIEQLKIWGERTQSPVLSRPLGADSAGLAYDAWAEAKEQRRDVLLMDTAGRLQNKSELMAELEKIVRVLKKQDPSAPHTVLLTLDATTGQNALNQVEIFRDVAGVNGLVMTKLDGTARGGILVSISAKHKLPVFFVGVGEQVEDLEPFEAREFARSIVGLPREDEEEA